MPLAMIVASIALNALFFLNGGLSWTLFRMFALVSLFSYLFTTLYSFCIDPQTSKRVWFAGMMFPGLISLINMFIAVAPHHVEAFVHHVFAIKTWSIYDSYIMIWVNTWISLCMFFAWLVYRLDRANVSQRITNPLLLLVGYGPLLCVITFAAYIAQLTHKKIKWDKTIKTGKVKPKRILRAPPYSFKKTLLLDKKEEFRLFFYEVVIIALLLFLCFLHQSYGIS
jgi:hypothetical protein